jgi:predicted transcriptional regulator
MEAFRGWLDAALDAILRGRPERGARRRRVRAAIGHSLAFETWRSLAIHRGLSRSEAIELMEALAAAARRD